MTRNIWQFLNFTQYGLLIFIGIPALLDIDTFTLRWWLALGGLVLLAVLIILYNNDRIDNRLFLWMETALISGLVILNPFFMILGFNLAAHASFSLPIREAVWPTGTLILVTAAAQFYSDGWLAGLFSAMATTFGYFSFASFSYLRKQSEEAHHETRRLLEELREAHHQLEIYAGQAQDLAVAEERNRLSRELHDSVKQQAFAVSAQLATARSLLQKQPAEAEQHMMRAEALMDEIRSELAQLIHELRPSALLEQGLAAALREWGAKWSRSNGIALQVQVQGDSSLPPKTGQALLRITQEALANTARHSQAKNAEVRLEFGDNWARLKICDDGSGFDPNLPQNGLGLRSMRERAEQLPEGRITFHSTPDAGTQIEVQCVI